MRHLIARALVAVAVLAGSSGGSAQSAPSPTPNRIAIRAGRLIDGLGGTPATDMVILVENERITAVGKGLAIPAGAKVIDLSRSTVLPGFIDAHTHVTSQPG